MIKSFPVIDVYGYFRAVYHSGEVSQRALDITTDALDLNPANYTVWHHRRYLLKELKSDVYNELEFCRDVIEQHPKNYQVWYVVYTTTQYGNSLSLCFDKNFVKPTILQKKLPLKI